MPTIRKLTMQKVLALLEDGRPRTCREVSAELCMNNDSIACTLAHMRTLNRVHVCGYYYDTTAKPSKKWTAGKGKDVAPPRYTEKARREATERRIAKQKERIDFRGVTPFRHPQDAIFFGSYPKSFTPTIPAGRIFRNLRDDEFEAAV